MSAFEAARAAGVVDTFLSMPAPRQEKVKVYDSIRKQSLDTETQSMEMPAEYMFKDVPKYEELSDPVAEVLQLMDEHGIQLMMPGIHENEHARRACRDHPDRFAGIAAVNPNHGMESVRELTRFVREDGAVAAHVWGTGLSPQVPINDKKMYPLYAKCVELDVPIILYAGVPGPRILMSPQEVGLLDEVCWFFPELRIVVRHGAEPWTELMVKLLLKWPNLYYSTSAFAPKHYPQDIIHFANTRGADKIIYAGYYSAGLGLDRIFSELPNVPFRDHVWPKFLRENAVHVFGLEERIAGVSDNSAFEAAMAAGGAVDTSVGVPKSREDMFQFYGFIRDQAKDAESKQGEGNLAMPAGYMFKEPPGWDDDELGDPVELLIAEHDRHGITKAIVSVEDEEGARAVREHPERFFASIGANPNTGMEAVRKIERYASEFDLKCVGAFPAGLNPQVAVDDKMWFPIYAKCVELDIPFASTMGVPGPRIPFSPQDVARLDEICWYFPELKFVTRHGCEPWTELAVKLMLKWPNLYYSTTAFAPKYYPQDVVHYANTRGADKIIWSGYFPAGLTYDRIFTELPDVPFRDHVWPKFLHENATRVFKLGT